MLPATKKLAQTLLQSPEQITVHAVASTTDDVKQQVYKVNRNYKRQLLQQITKRRDLETILVFVNTKDECAKVFEFVKSSGVRVDFISKDKTQNGRQRALDGIKDKRIKVLVATDIVSRGLDIHNLSCVINYDMPGDPEIYVHRIGRTARAGKKGLSISFCTNADMEKLEKIEKMTKKKLIVMTDDSYKKEIVAKGKWPRTAKIYKKESIKKKRKKIFKKK